VRSLRWRLLWGLAVLVLLAVASSGFLVLQVARARLQSAQLDAALALGEQLAAVLKHGPPSQLGVAAQELIDSGAVADVVIIDENRRPLVGEPRGDPELRPMMLPSVVRRSPWLDVYTPMGRGGARFRMRGDDQLSQALSGATALLVTLTLVDSALVLLFGALFIRRVVGPLSRLAQAARQVGEGQLDGPPVPVPPGGDEIGDLTERFNQMTRSLRQQREHLVQQEKLATVGRLAAGVAHEVGNPLAAILGYADILRQNAAPGDKEMLERIGKETERIRTIIRDLLEYSRPVAGAVEEVPLRRTVEAAASLLRPQARFREVTVDNRVPEALSARANDSRLLQIFINLFLNAADAMGGRGTITVEAEELLGRVEIHVRDQGPGVPREDRLRIFDPFFTTKDPGQGTGLGLAVSRSIAQAWGGDLRLGESESGALFVISLPQ
jgi:two-component system, NtrC family, sensor kinase